MEVVELKKEVHVLAPKLDKDVVKKVEHYAAKFDELRREIEKTMVGQKEAVNSLLEALMANGHVLVEGVPGIGKTLLVKTLTQVTGCVFSRIQFTPDLLPTDIVGITTYEEGRGFFTIKGPIFANFVLADEINRAPPKVQSALLESMQERQATIGKETFFLPNPFFVMATQNPVETLGTYKLPEAEVDRFIFKIVMGYPDIVEEQAILKNNITLKRFEDFNVKAILSTREIIDLQEFVKKIYLDEKVEKYIVRLVDATRHWDQYDIKLGKYIQYGGSPRTSIALFIAAKAHALLNGRSYATPQDVKDVALKVMRHRILLNFEGEAEEVNPDEVVKEVLSKVPIL
ncbi:MAG TPA: MoxR family ATPase [Candidatus Nanoarchaeia archaeon]|nr:MoxR family ATPase [Candidatus Nanoarchaeia archaeon]